MADEISLEERSKEDLIRIIKEQQRLYVEEFDRFARLLKELGELDLLVVALRFRDHAFYGFKKAESNVKIMGDADPAHHITSEQLQQQIIGIIRLFGETPLTSRFIKDKIVGHFRESDWVTVVKNLSHLDGVLKEGVGATRTYRMLRR